jgi:hypothetical protein
MSSTMMTTFVLAAVTVTTFTFLRFGSSSSSSSWLGSVWSLASFNAIVVCLQFRDFDAFTAMMPLAVALSWSNLTSETSTSNAKAVSRSEQAAAGSIMGQGSKCSFFLGEAGLSGGRNLGLALSFAGFHRGFLLLQTVLQGTAWAVAGILGEGHSSQTQQQSIQVHDCKWKLGGLKNKTSVIAKR